MLVKSNDSRYNEIKTLTCGKVGGGAIIKHVEKRHLIATVFSLHNTLSCFKQMKNRKNRLMMDLPVKKSNM